LEILHFLILQYLSSYYFNIFNEIKRYFFEFFSPCEGGDAERQRGFCIL